MEKRISQFLWFFGISVLLLAIFGCASNPKSQTDPKQPEERPPELVVKVYPTLTSAGISGATVRIEYRILPLPGNRSYRISWADEGGEWGAKGRDLDGENEPYIFPWIFVGNLFEGQYTVRLVVIRVENGEDKEHTVSQRFTVQ